MTKMDKDTLSQFQTVGEPKKTFNNHSEKRFVNNMVMLRKINGLTQVDLAKEIGIQDHHIQHMEAYRIKFDEKVARQVAEYFEIEFDDLMNKKIIVTYEFK